MPYPLIQRCGHRAGEWVGRRVASSRQSRDIPIAISRNLDRDPRLVPVKNEYLIHSRYGSQTGRAMTRSCTTTSPNNSTGFAVICHQRLLVSSARTHDTLSSKMRGEPLMPHSLTLAPVSFTVSRAQISRPVSKSRQVRMPVAPKE